MATVQVSPTAELIQKFATRLARVGVVGMGYVGLPLALLFTEAEYPVTGFHIDGGKVAALMGGGYYIASTATAEVSTAIGRGFSATGDFSAVAEMDAVVICMPTPLNDATTSTQMPRRRGGVAALNDRKKAVRGAHVLVLGVAYKKDVDDLRESPALTIIELLHKMGAEVRYNDPYFPFVGRGRKYGLQMKLAPLDDLAQYDCVLIVTDHSSYDYVALVEQSQLVVDTRNATAQIVSSNIVRC